jgi:hypothetical protein
MRAIEHHARVAELADAPDLGCGGPRPDPSAPVGCSCADLHFWVLRLGLHAAALALIGEGWVAGGSTTRVGQLWLERLQLAGGLPAFANKNVRTRH